MFVYHYLGYKIFPPVCFSISALVFLEKVAISYVIQIQSPGIAENSSGKFLTVMVPTIITSRLPILYSNRDLAPT